MCTKILGAFDNLHKLELLNLRKNKLTALPEGLFANLHNLKTLLLNSNKLAQVGLQHRL